jgi:hypothetical protein
LKATVAASINNRAKFGLKIFLGAVLLLCVAVVTLCAEPAGVSAGGGWMVYDRTDPMTGYKESRFVLQSNNTLRDSSEKAMVQIFCDHGKYKLGDFRPNGRLGRPNFPGFWGQPQMRVFVRTDDRHFHRDWNWVRGEFLSMDKDTVRGLIGSQVFNVEFRTPRGAQIAEFTPAGLDLARVQDACHLSPKKPLSED